MIIWHLPCDYFNEICLPFIFKEAHTQTENDMRIRKTYCRVDKNVEDTRWDQTHTPEQL